MIYKYHQEVNVEDIIQDIYWQIRPNFASSKECIKYMTNIIKSNSDVKALYEQKYEVKVKEEEDKKWRPKNTNKNKSEIKRLLNHVENKTKSNIKDRNYG